MQVLNVEELDELVEGLESDQSNQYTHILTNWKKLDCAGLNAEELGELVEGLESNQINQYHPHPYQLKKIGLDLNAEELDELVEGLEAYQINQYTHILTNCKNVLCRF
jgi:hypothetical protein